MYKKKVVNGNSLNSGIYNGLVIQTTTRIPS